MSATISAFAPAELETLVADAQSLTGDPDAIRWIRSIPVPRR